MQIDKIIKSMQEYFGESSDQIPHTLNVLSYAKEIYKADGIPQLRDDYLIKIIEIACILHDIGVPEAIRKYGTSSPKYQEKEGPDVARKMMLEHNVQSEIIDRVCYIVGNHHTIKKIDGIDFQILWEADYLVNIEEEWIRLKPGSYQKAIEKNFKTAKGIELIKKQLEIIS